MIYSSSQPFNDAEAKKYVGQDVRVTILTSDGLKSYEGILQRSYASTCLVGLERFCNEDVIILRIL